MELQRRKNVVEEQGGRRSWKEFYEDVNTAQSPEEAKLVFESKELLKAWNAQSQDTQNSRLSDIFPVSSGISLADLKTLVSGLKDKQRPQGRAHRYLSSICKTIDSHKTMMSMLPDQSMYTSVFCGTFKTLIEASVRHGDILEVLSRGLMDAGDMVQSCVQRAILVDILEIRSLVQSLYATVFTLMRQALTWYEDKRIKRLLNSFNDKYLEPFKSTLHDIRKIVDMINTKAAIAHHAEMRDTRLMIEEMEARQQEYREENTRLWERAYQKIEEQNNVLREIPNRQILGDFISSLFPSGAAAEIAPPLLYHNSMLGIPQEQVKWPQSLQRDVNGQFPSSRLSGIREGHLTRNTYEYLKSDLQINSKDLEDYIASPLDVADIFPGTEIFAEFRIVCAVEKLCASTTSQILWIMGKSDRQYPSSTSGIAASVVNALSLGSVPALYMFIDWPTSDKEAAISLLYSLIRQLLNLMPEEITARCDCGMQSFSYLTGSLDSWEIGIGILEALFQYIPPLTFMVIDGFEHLDFLSPGENQVQSLLRMLQEQVLKTRITAENRDAGHKTFKILFTTAGNSGLLNGLSEDGLTILKTNENQNIRPGQWRAGRANLSLMTLNKYYPSPGKK